jgi:xenotropic and polytropic retrovirus receptor 1
MQVHRKLATDRSVDGAVAGEVYETAVAGDGAGFADAEAAKAFFQRLDQQLNKVNRFYEREEREFLERGESLRRQLQILLELKAAVTQQQQARRGGSAADTDDPSVSWSIQLGETNTPVDLLD